MKKIRLSLILALALYGSANASQVIDRTTDPVTRTFLENLVGTETLEIANTIMQNGGELVISNPDNVYTVTNPDDLLAITVAMGTPGTFTVTNDTILNINAVGNFISPVNYNVSGAAFEMNMSDSAQYVYLGTNTFYTTYDSASSPKDVNAVAYTPGTQLFDITGTSQSLQFFSPLRCIFTYFDLGTITYIGVLSRGTLFVDWKDTLEITDINNVLFNEIASNQPGFIPNAKPMIYLNTSYGDPLANINIVTAGGYVLPFDSFIRLDAGISDDARTLLSNVTLSRGDLFDTSGNTDEFTAVADASISAQAISSVTDSSGIARFNWTPGATVYVGQEVQVSGYVSNPTYNGTHIVTASGSGYYEVSSIAFGSNEATGSFDSDSVTITSAAHGLSNLDGVTIDTSLAIDYDGGATIYNVQTDTFQIDREWTETKTGTWSTEGLDQEDPRIFLTSSPSFKESQQIGFAHMELNSENTEISAADTYQDMNLVGSSNSITAFTLVGAGITRVTSAGHGLSNLQNIEIEGTIYDGIYRVFNVATDTFDINVDYSATDTGVWYSRLLEGISNERFKITNYDNGESTCISKEPVNGNVVILLSVSKSGNAEKYIFSVAVNDEVYEGAPFTLRTVSTASGALTVKVPVSLVYGDRIKPQIAALGVTDNIKIENINIDISK
jgi:hypothetical protein